VSQHDYNIGVWDLDHEKPLTRLTFGPAFEVGVAWTHNGQSVIFSSGALPGLGASNLFQRAADGTGPVEQLTQDTAAIGAFAVTPDGTGLIFSQRPPAGGTAGDLADLMLLPLMGDRRPKPLVQTASSEA